MKRGSNDDSPEVDILAVGDTTLNSTAPVGICAQGTILPANEGVVVLAAGDFGSAEARADLEAFGSGDGEHGVAELGLDLVEDGFTETGGDTADDASDGTTDGILSLFGTEDALQVEQVMVVETCRL